MFYIKCKHAQIYLTGNRNNLVMNADLHIRYVNICKRLDFKGIIVDSVNKFMKPQFYYHINCIIFCGYITIC